VRLKTKQTSALTITCQITHIEDITCTFCLIKKYQKIRAFEKLAENCFSFAKQNKAVQLLNFYHSFPAAVFCSNAHFNCFLSHFFKGRSPFYPSISIAQRVGNIISAGNNTVHVEIDKDCSIDIIFLW